MPKISKKIKLKVLASALAAIFLISIFIIDYFYCLIPQNVTIKTFDNIKLIKFENGIIAKANKNDKIEIIAYKNILNTKTRNEIKVLKSDIEVATNGNKIKVITPNITFSNLGTDFETVVKNKTAISVFDGKIKSKNIIVNFDEGLIASKTIQKISLPAKVSNVIIKNNPSLVITFNSKYNSFKILIAKDKQFSTTPIYSYLISTTTLKPDIPDGEWFVNIKAKEKGLYSLPVIKKFLSLNNYYKALHYYQQHDLNKALFYIRKSISTINFKSPKPYYLYAKILFEFKKYTQALKFIQQGERVGDKNQIKFLKAKIYFIQKKYNDVIKTLNKPQNNQEKLLLAKAYYKLKKYKLANKYLYQILETDPNNKEALKLLKLPHELKIQGILNESN